MNEYEVEINGRLVSAGKPPRPQRLWPFVVEVKEIEGGAWLALEDECFRDEAERSCDRKVDEDDYPEARVVYLGKFADTEREIVVYTRGA